MRYEGREEQVKSRLFFRSFTIFLPILLTIFLISGCEQGKPHLNFSTEYQAVFLDNGQAFFGKLENAGSAYPLLRNVFYVRSQVNQETKEVKNILIKRGNEWHGPEYMYLNSAHIVLIEPVGANSKVAELIKAAKPAAPSPSPQPESQK